MLSDSVCSSTGTLLPSPHRSSSLRKMMRMPKGVSPASGRQAVGLPCSQQKMKLLSTGGVKTDFFLAGLSSPQMNTVPAGYFTQICNTSVAEQRANSLYSTPHGPEVKPIRSSSGRLPVNNHTNISLGSCFLIV